MNKFKLGLLALLVVAAAVAGGFLWGAWGRWETERQLRSASLRWELAEASAALSAARVDVAELNFGQAGGNIDRAKKALEAASADLEGAGLADSTAAVKDAIARASDAQQLTARADQSASARIADALKALARASATVPTQAK
jgi:hypothetical protein